MSIRIRTLLFCLAASFAACSSQQASLPAGRWVDLSHGFDSAAIYWPTNEPFRRTTVFEGLTDKGYYYSSYKYSAEEHGGTHFDAPKHFAQGGKSVDQIPLTQLIGEGAVIDVRAKVEADRNYQVQVDDFLAWEAAHGRLPDHAMVLVNTGFSRFWPDAKAYTGTALRGPQGVAALSFPGLAPAAAAWLTTARTINAFGLDTPSIDYGRSTLFETHRTLFAAGVVAFENVAGLDELPARGSTVIALPMKIAGGSGAPLRLIALVPEQQP